MALHAARQMNSMASAVRKRQSRSRIEILRAAWQEYERDYANYFAGAIVYYALVSLVPLLLLLLAVLGLSLRLTDVAADAERQLLQAIELHLGAELREAMQNTLEQIERGSVVATLVGVLGLLLAASKLFRHLRTTFRAIWKHAPLLTSGLRHAVRVSLLERAIAFAMVLAGGALLVGAFALVASLHWLSGLLSDVPILGATMGNLVAGLLTPILIAFVAFGLMFKILPPVRLSWTEVWFATVLSTSAWVVGVELFALYVTHFGSKLSAYGVVGGVLILLLWMHAMSKVLFFGAEVCKVVAAQPPHNWPSVQ